MSLRQIIKEILLFESFAGDNVESLADFIVRSNEIEGYDVSRDEVLDAIQGYQEGYPLSYLTNDPHIFSHLSGLKESESVNPQSMDGASRIHKAMGPGSLDQGTPGTLRSFSGTDVKSSLGKKYVPATEVGEALSWWESQSFNDPFEAHAAYENIHPFDDGNGRSGRIILAAMLGYDFDKVNSLIGADYYSRLNKYDSKFIGDFWNQ